MYHSFGSQIFTKSIHNYLTTRQFKTAKPEHLWQSIQDQTDKNILFKNMNVTVKELMDSWTSQPGHPVVNVTVSSDKVTLTQVSLKKY